MNRNLLLTIVGALIAMGTDIAQAKECKGVNFPDQAQVEGSNLTLNGLGLRQATMLKVSVYVAALYTAKPSADPNAILGSDSPKELILQFVRDVGADDLEGLGRRLRKECQGTATGPEGTHRNIQGLDGRYQDRATADVCSEAGRGHPGRGERHGEGND